MGYYLYVHQDGSSTICDQPTMNDEVGAAFSTFEAASHFADIWKKQIEQTNAYKKSFTHVKCCDRNDSRVYLDHEDNLFYLGGVDAISIEYCPWCGILLDTNLLGK